MRKAVAKIVPLPRELAEWGAFAALYVGLDWVSFLYPLAPIGITPWNPAPGMALAVMILRGPGLAPLVVVSAVLADVVVRGASVPLLLSIATGLVVALGYGAAAKVLRDRLSLDAGLARLRDVFALTGAAVVAALVVAMLYVGAFAGAGLVPRDQVFQALSRYWIGDMIGIAVATPLLLVHRPSRWRRPPAVELGEMALQGGSIALALWLIFGIDEIYELRFFYILFLPLIWIGSRFGIRGATLGNLAAQAGLIVAFLTVGHISSTVTTFQYLMLALATATLFLGAAVSERRGVEDMLRTRQDELAHTSRLSLAGEMAGALAHELNQPLLASIAFTRAAQRMLAHAPPDIARAGGALDRAVSEAQRAGAIIRALREFIGKGDTRREPESLAVLVADALALVAPECARKGVRLVMGVDKSLPAVHVDRVQVQQVVLNLVRNAMEASAREVAVAARVADDGLVEVEVRDNGSGVSDEVEERLFEPFNTSKASGMGLGLSISRTIVEAHGGRLWLAENGPRGAAFRLTLRIAPAAEEGERTEMGTPG